MTLSLLQEENFGDEQQRQELDRSTVQGIGPGKEQEMKRNIKLGHVTPVGANIFADLGFEPTEAAKLLEASNRIISEKLSIKESLMTELAAWIEEKDLRQADAARILGVTRPRVSDVVNKKSIKFTIDSLVDMLARTGMHVQLSVL
jgi:predicted XRE-type DNA-binding protein